MDIHVDDIKSSYVYLTDTEEHKNDIINRAIEDNKEACYVGYGTGEINSEYQPSPNKEPDYYMRYCNSDNYDYLKDYRLVWGYGIGIIETDVIVNVDTGEHLAEGKDACDAYIAPEGVNTKRGIWLRFSGNNFKDAVKIQQVVLPKEIISIKNLTNALTSSRLEIYGFNSENIINWDYAFTQNETYIDKPNRDIYFNDYIYDLSSTKCMNGTFNVSSVRSLTDNNKLYCKNVSENIIANYGFYQCEIIINIEDLCSNYIGGNHFLYGTKSGRYKYDYHLENFKIIAYRYTFCFGDFYFHNTIIKLQEDDNRKIFNNNYDESNIIFYGFPIFISDGDNSYLGSYNTSTNVTINSYPNENSILIDFTKFKFIGSESYCLFNVIYLRTSIDIKINKDSYVQGTFFKIEHMTGSINFIDDCFCNNKNSDSLFMVYGSATLKGNIGGINFITLSSITSNSKINIINKKEDNILSCCITVRKLNQYIIDNITYDNTFFNPFFAYTGDITYPEFDDSYIPTVNFKIDNTFKTIGLLNYSNNIVLKANINTDNYTFSEDKILSIFASKLLKYFNANFTKRGYFHIFADYLKITNGDIITWDSHILSSDCNVIIYDQTYVHSCNKLYINYRDELSSSYNNLNTFLQYGNHINIKFKTIYILKNTYDTNGYNENGTFYIIHNTLENRCILPIFVFYDDNNNNVINEDLVFLNEDESNFDLSTFEYILLNGYININANLLSKEIISYNKNNNCRKGFSDVVPNLKIINDTENDIITVGNDIDNDHYLTEVTNDFSMFHWYGTVTSSYKENPTTACLIPSIIEDSFSDDYFCLNEELTFINCTSKNNTTIFQLGTEDYYLSKLKVLNLQLYSDINYIYINSKIIHTGDSLQIINITNSYNTIGEFHLDYCDGLIEDMIDNIINYNIKIKTLYINETFYAKFTSEQLQQIIDKNITLISIKNV